MQIKKFFIPTIFIISTSFVSLIPSVLNDHKKTKINVDNSITKNNYMVSKTTTETVLTASILNELNWNTQETIGFDAWHKNAPNVTSIESGVFSSMQFLKNIEIPSNITTVASDAFSNNPNLTSIKMNFSLKTSGTAHRYGLTQIQWDAIEWMYTPFSGTDLDKAAAISIGWDKRTTITFDDWRTMAPNVTIISGAFQANKILKTIQIPKKIQAINKDTFDKALFLRHVIFEEGSVLKTIGAKAFHSTELTTIDLPDSITSIDEGAFSYIPSLISFSFPPKLKVISARVLMFTAVSEIIIPHDVKNIQNEAFDGNSRIRKIVIPDSVEMLGTGVFASTPILKDISMNIKFKTSTPSYGFTQTQWDLIQWTHVPFYGTDLDKAATISIGWDQKEIITLADWRTMAPNVTTISGAFLNHEILTSIEIPNEIETIGDSSFYATINLNKVIFEMNSKLNSIGFDAFRKIAISSMIIPPTVSVICGSAFAENLLLTSLTLPSSLKIIEHSLFLNTALQEIIIPDNVVEIQELAFSNTNIKKIIIPNNVKKIGFNTFIETSQLTNISLPSHFKEILTDFGFTQTQWNKVKWVLSPTQEKVLTKELVIKLGWENKANILLDDWRTMAPNIETISGAFENNKNLISIEIPNYVLNFGFNSFKNTKSLEEINFEDNSKLKVIEEDVFFGTSLKSIIIPYSVIFIDKNAFRNTLFNNIQISSKFENSLDFFGLSNEQWNNINWIYEKPSTKFIIVASSLFALVAIQGIILIFSARAIKRNVYE